MSRTKPYSFTQSTWKSVLSCSNIIPMNQRNYDWDIDPQISKFINDLFHIYKHTPYFEKMGTIIYYTGNKEGKEVWDGQQRLLTILMTLRAISYVSSMLSEPGAENFSISIMNYLKEDIDTMVEITSKIKQFKKKYPEYNNIPKVHCINPHDDKALADIYNSYKPLIYYYNINQVDNTNEKDIYEENDNNEEDDDGEEDDTDNENTNTNINLNTSNYKCVQYFCKKCKIIINKNQQNREQDFVRHLSKCVSYKDTNYSSKNTKIYKSYEYICKILYHNFNNLKDLKEFYLLILNYIDLGVYECSDLEYVSKIFEWENNRGKPVESLDIIKNSLLSNIDSSNRLEIYDKWNEIKSKTNKIYTNYGQKIMNCAIQIYNKNIIQIGYNFEDMYRGIYCVANKNDECYNNINIFFKIVDKLFDIMDEINKDKYGRLLFVSKNCILSWEAYTYLLLPIFYFGKKIDKKLINLLAKWYFRNINASNRTFNSLCYASGFINICNKFIKDPTYNYYDAVLSLLIEQMNTTISSNNYVNNNAIKEWKKGTLAKMLLYFYETCNCNDDEFPSLDHDLEHIIPQNKKNTLKSPNNIYKLGNLTILESKNSENNHKGNRSIKDSSFIDKKSQYKNSAHRITRKLFEKEDFTEENIISRTQELFNSLEILTNFENTQPKPNDKKTIDNNNNKIKNDKKNKSNNKINLEYKSDSESESEKKHIDIKKLKKNKSTINESK